MLVDLQDKVAVVTGGAGGIGAALARRFAGDGMRVVVADIDASGAESVADELRASGGAAVSAGCDVADSTAVGALADLAYETYGAVHVLCNNAGVFQGGWLWESTDEDWEWALGVNLFGILHGIRSFVPRMIDGGEWGHVVNTASVASFVSAATTGPYNVSKAAALMLTETLAKELAAVGAPIGVSALIPSATRTAIADSHRHRPGYLVTEQSAASMAVNSGLAAMLEQGIDPSECADAVADALASGDFLIPTKPSYAAQLRSRSQALVARQLPGDVAVD